MRVLFLILVLILPLSARAASSCAIPGKAELWAYDACFSQFETDDELHPGVMACVERSQALIRSKGSCAAKRIFKGKICNIIRQTPGRRPSYQACMDDPSIVGSTVKNGGL